MNVPSTSVVATGNAAELLVALAESRARWRAIVRTGADLGFETGADGRFTLIEPETALGWPQGHLIGTDAQALLIDTGSAALNPFRIQQPVRNQRVWLRHASGSACCLLLSVAPIAGCPGGIRGLGICVTEAETDAFQAARSLCVQEITRVLTDRIYRGAAPFAGIANALADLNTALQAEGSMLILREHGQPLRVAASGGSPWQGAIQPLQDWLAAHCNEPSPWYQTTVRQGRIMEQSLMLAAGANRFIDNVILLFWRSGHAWNADETALAGCMLRSTLPILDHEQIHRETVRRSMTDGLTGLFNRPGFMTELARRIDRIDSDEVDATLFVIGLDGLSAINRQAGLEAGDGILQRAATLLRRAVRGTDLVGRLAGDVFALWLDRTDQFVAAERAYALSRQVLALPATARDPDLPPDLDAGRLRVGFSIGLAVRPSRSMESLDSLRQRGWSAMRACKRAGGGTWQVSHEEPWI